MPKKDKRQINKVWVANNREVLYFVYARVGSGKNSYIKTIGYRKPKQAAEKMASKARR